MRVIVYKVLVLIFISSKETKMKKKILLTISAIFILALGIVAFAVNQSNNFSKTTAPDSCAMKGMNAAHAEGQTKTSCCDKEDCCCKTGVCPMKKQGGNALDNCCADCCGSTCPMKNKQAQAMSVEAQNGNVSSDETCEKKHS